LIFTLLLVTVSVRSQVLISLLLGDKLNSKRLEGGIRASLRYKSWVEYKFKDKERKPLKNGRPKNHSSKK
jgi:hypothetical protein